MFLTKPKLPYPLGPQHLTATEVATSDCMMTQGPLCAARTETVAFAPVGTSSTLRFSVWHMLFHHRESA